MTDQRRPTSDLTRRFVVAGIAAGALGETSRPAAAQRCIGAPPPHVKGPAVWLDLDQQELDDAYDQDVYAFNGRNIAERMAANNAKALAVIGKPERVAYGPAEIEKRQNDLAGLAATTWPMTIR